MFLLWTRRHGHVYVGCVRLLWASSSMSGTTRKFSSKSHHKGKDHDFVCFFTCLIRSSHGTWTDPNFSLGFSWSRNRCQNQEFRYWQWIFEMRNLDAVCRIPQFFCVLRRWHGEHCTDADERRTERRDGIIYLGSYKYLLLTRVALQLRPSVKSSRCANFKSCSRHCLSVAFFLR